MIDAEDVCDFVKEASLILMYTNLLSIPALFLVIIGGETGISLFYNYFGLWIICFVVVYATWSKWLCRF